MTPPTDDPMGAIRVILRELFQDDHDAARDAEAAIRPEVARLTREREELIEALKDQHEAVTQHFSTRSAVGFTKGCYVCDLLARLTDPETPERTR